MIGVKPTDIVIPVAVYNDMQKKIEHLNADTRRKGKALAKALKQIDELNGIIAKQDKPQDDLLRDALRRIDELTPEVGAK
tara:strand:+ start:95 stop:334 length:240 start_codon:yes stop_codon:yes gene_type:complete